jgi:hypothetical protein
MDEEDAILSSKDIGVQKLHKGSKNPPLDTPIFLKCKGGDWGIGHCVKFGSTIYFDFHSYARMLYGVKKSKFVAWMHQPK